MMVAPQAKMLSMAVKQTFKGKGIKVPDKYDDMLKQTAGCEVITDVKNVLFAKKDINPKVFNLSSGDFKPGSPKPTNIFSCPGTDKIAVGAQNYISDLFIEFIDDVTNAICSSWSTWQSSLKFAGVIINAAIGISPPGSLVGAPMAGPTIFARCKVGGKAPSYIKHAKAICMAVGSAMTTWQTGYTNPSIPFPGGAVCSVTMPPSPNVPVPVASGQSPGDPLMQAAMLKTVMLGNFGSPGLHTEPLFDSFAQEVAKAFTQWKASTQIMQIMGAGGAAPPPPAPPGPVAGAIGNGGMLQ